MENVINTIIHGDCMQIMPLLPEASVDLIFCDLPFGTTRNPWDKLLPLDALWQQYERLMKPKGVIVLFANPPFDKMLWASNPNLYKYDWVWEKNKATGHLNSRIRPMSAHEYLCVFYKKEPVYNPQMTFGHHPMTYAKRKATSSVYGHVDGVCNVGTTDRFPRSVLKYPVVNNDDPERIHPNQKPVSLCEYMISTYTMENDLVLDSCTGSGSIPVAAQNLNRRFIGIEKWYNFAVQAQERVQNSPVLFSI